VTQLTRLHHKRLVAHTSRLDDDVDIFDALTAPDFAWWHHHQGLVTSGVARRVPVRDVHEVLSDIDTSGGCEASAARPVAVGALPFDPLAVPEAELVVPARVWRRDAEGRIWVTQISETPDAEVARGPEPGLLPTPGETPPDTSPTEWARAVGTALERIRAGQLDKVVLARQVTLESDAEFSVTDVVRRLRSEQPACFVFAAGGFVGASPELLVERQATTVRSRPMAGTAEGRGDRAMTWLAQSVKNRWEHSLVVDAVVAGLQPMCSGPVAVSPPRAEPFADLAHIVTDVVGTLGADAPSALQLALVLHPTPAVAGTPTDTALSLIGALEARSRRHYGGPVGWVDADGDGEFAVALRCAELQGNRAVLCAGAGIVAGSKAQDEWHETEIKLGAMRRALAGR
jgi:menaquinone-specific isochorismate synthase